MSAPGEFSDGTPIGLASDDEPTLRLDQDMAEVREKMKRASDRCIKVARDVRGRR